MSNDLIVISLEPWDQVWRRNQHLVSGVMRRRARSRVLFVEPPSDVGLALTRRRSPRRGRGLRKGPEISGAPDSQLWLYQPTKIWPRRLDPGFDRRRAGAIRRAARRLALSNPVVWINDADGAPLLDSGWPSVYDITDDWLAADRPPAEIARLARQEADLLARADEVVVCSPALAGSKRSDRPIKVITNGVDLDAYRDPGDRPADLPSGRVALYIGTLHADRLDVELCAATAAALQRTSEARATLVLVGPDALDEPSRAEIVAAGGAILGSRPSAQIPAYAAAADALVVPHLVNAFTDSLNPIKLYEYLAAGRPVVSTPVAGFREQDWTTISLAAAEYFPAAVLDAVMAGTPRVDPPNNLPTWHKQSAAMSEVLNRVSRAIR